MLLVYEIFVCHAAFVHCQATVFHIPKLCFLKHTTQNTSGSVLWLVDINLQSITQHAIGEPRN